MPDFAQHFTLETFKRFQAHENARPRDSDPDHGTQAANQRYDAWRKQYQEMLREQMDTALYAFLEALRDEGKMAPIAHSDGYEITVVTFWNRMAAGETLEEYQRSRVAHDFTHRLIFNACYRRDGAPERSDSEISQQYGKLVAKVNAGDFDELGDYECAKTDFRGYLNFAGWQGTLGHISRDSHDFVPAPPVAPDQVQTVKLTLKTGHLLVADWFRIEEFTKVTRREDEYARENSINHAAGRERATRWYAELGFVSVHVGNTCPQVLRRGNTLTVGGWRSEEAELEAGDSDAIHYENVCTDLWWVTMIEREQLVALVAKSVGETEAERLVTEYLEKDSDHQEISLPPGEYFLHFSGNYHDFDRLLQADEITRNEVEPYFALSDRDLTLAPTAGKTRKARKTQKP